MPVYVVPVLDFRICVLKSRIMIILECNGKLWSWKSLKFVYDDGDQPFAVIYNDGSTSRHLGLIRQEKSHREQCRSI